MSSSSRSNTSVGKSAHEVGDDFATLNLDRPMKRELKTAEQIQKHSLDCYLESRVIERALHLLSTGEEIQKLSVVKSIPNLLLEDSTGCLQRVIPRMQQTLPHGSTEYNMAACSTVQTIAQKNLISPENFTKSFLQHILNSIESKDTVAADAWLTTLIDVINCLPPNVLQTEVFPVFAGKAHISKPVRVRVVSCRVLARLADLLPTPVVIKDVLPVIISLCQDVTGEVRASMCRELPNVPQLLNQESNKYLFNSIIDLANDEDSSVREAALHCISELIQYIPAISIKSTIIPLTKKLFGAAIESEDRSIVEVAHLYGVYCIRLKGFLSLADKTWFLSRYVHLSQLNTTMRRKPDRFRLVTSSEEEELNQRLTQCRLQCAYNFPAMVAFSADLKSEYSEQLLVVLQNLTGDSFCLVRRCIASGFHELFKLQPKWIPMLRIEFIKLLKDDNEKVLEGLVPQIGTILTICSRPHQGPDKMDWKDVAQALLTCERMLFESLTWRLHSQLLNQLEIVPKCFPAEFVNVHFVPLLMQRCDSTRTLPCRMAAIKIILILMSDDSQSKQKQKMRNKLLELCNSYNFYSRMTFVRAITLLLDISPKLLKEMFYLNIIAMAEDKIPNIRIAVCKIIPKLKEIAFEPYDRKLIAAIESSVRRFANEEDRDVLAQIKIMHTELDAVDSANKTVKRDYDTTVLEATSYASFGQTSSLKNTKLLLGTSDKTMTVYSPSLMPRSGQLTHHSFITNRYNPTASSSLPITPIRRATKTTVPANRPVARRLEDTLTTDSFLIDAGIPLPTASCSGKTTIHVTPSQNGINLSTSTSKTPESSCVNGQEKIERKSPMNSKIHVNSSNILKPTRRLPTPRPTHRFTSYTGLSNNMDSSDVEKPDMNSNETVTDNQDKVDGSLVMENKNSSVLKVINKKINERPSGLPLKINQTNKLSLDDVICETASNTELFSHHILKNKYGDRFKIQPNKTTDTKKRHSLDVDTISNRTIKMPNKYSNVNKRYSLTVEVKKDSQIKNSLTCINNNIHISNTKLMTPASTSTIVTKHQPRPQSCVLKNSEAEAFSNTKRSMSVENLPPRSLRSASRLPVRAVDPKTSKPK